MAKRRFGSVVTLLLLVLLVACGSHEAPPPPPPALEVWGDMASGRQTIYVRQGGVAVDDALVEVDGQRMYSACAGCGWYEGTVSPERLAGETLALEVTRGSSVVTGGGAVPESPVLTSPGDGGTYAWDQPIPVAWTSSSQPDRFEVRAEHGCNNTVLTSVLDAAGTARALTIPANSFALCSGPESVAVSVRAVNAGALTGDYVPHTDGHPGMNIGASSNEATLRR